MADAMTENTFRELPTTPEMHFRLHHYVAVFHLINHLRRQSSQSGTELEKVFARFGFLARYFEEMRPFLPEGLDWEATAAWWERELRAWEASAEGKLPFLILSQAGNLGLRHRLALMLVGLPEEDSRFGTLLAELQEPLTSRRAGLEWVDRVLAMPGPLGGSAAGPCSTLLEIGLVEAMNPEAPRSEWSLRVPQPLWQALKGSFTSASASWYRWQPVSDLPHRDTLLMDPRFLARLERATPLLQAGQALILRAGPGSDPVGILGSMAGSLGMNLLELKNADRYSEAQWKWVGPICLLTHSFPVAAFDPGPGESIAFPDLGLYPGPAGIILGAEGSVSGKFTERALTLTVPMPDLALRKRMWQRALQARACPEIDRIAECFHLPGGYIAKTAALAIGQAALSGSVSIGMREVREAARSLNRQLLDSLATHLQEEGDWTRLVVSESVGAKLLELQRRCMHRERILARLGPAFGGSANRGVRCLFTGPSGTGKTLAAKILASVLGMDLYRVDLASVINKYVGETEKNLNRILTRAEELDVILLLDEGDALLGKRTDVKGANDRYANLETNYLLQKLEAYQGIVVVTTNVGENIDSAFMRRMDVVVTFNPPGPRERLAIWRLHLPADHDLPDAYLEGLAERCEMTGGQIRNASMDAALTALDGGGDPVRTAHAEAAVRSEYRKAGAIPPFSGPVRSGHTQSLETFRSRLLGIGP